VSGTLAVDLIRHALMLTLTVAAPLLLTALVVGVLVGLLQALTQLQEQTLTFLPKLVAIAFVFVFTLPWAIQRLVEYLAGVLRSLPTLAS
jgi:flagellar biosynthetic protein FliQ